MIDLLYNMMKPWIFKSNITNCF